MFLAVRDDACCDGWSDVWPEKKFLLRGIVDVDFGVKCELFVMDGSFKYEVIRLRVEFFLLLLVIHIQILFLLLEDMFLLLELHMLFLVLFLLVTLPFHELLDQGFLFRFYLVKKFLFLLGILFSEISLVLAC